MIVKDTITLLEKHCLDYSYKFIKVWDNFCLVKDAYVSGYKDALAQVAKDLNVDTSNVGKEKVERERKQGEHQIGQKSTSRQDLITKEKLITRLEHDFNVKINELRWNEVDNVISFQGTMEKE